MTTGKTILPDPYLRLPPTEVAALQSWAETFWPFQREWLFDSSRYAISCKARQIGLSHTSAALGVLWGAYHGTLTTIVSKNEASASELVESAKKHVNVLAALGSELAIPAVERFDKLIWPSGGRLVALPSSGGRGFTGNVILDEFAYHPTDQDRKVWDAAMAATTLGFRGRVISTPNGLGNKFADVWKLARDPAFGWTRHEIPISKAVADGFPFDAAAARAIAGGSDVLYSQLYECQFVDADHRFLFNELPEDSLNYDVKSLPFCRQHAIGLDFATSTKTSADYSVAVVLGAANDDVLVLDVIREHLGPREFRDAVRALHARYPRATLHAFPNANEQGTVEFFREAGLPVSSTRATGKYNQAIPVATAWNEGRIRLPAVAPWRDALIAELTSFTGQEGRHDDMVDALAAAYHLLHLGGFDLSFHEALQAALPKPSIDWGTSDTGASALWDEHGDPI